MKKTVLTLMMLTAAIAANAQGIDPRFFNNQFLSIGGGVTLYGNDAGMSTGFNAEATIGNWILRDMAMRVSFGTASAENALKLPSSFYYGHCDFMWDAIGTIKGARHAKNVVSVYPMIGFGFLYRTDIPLPNDADTSIRPPSGLYNADTTGYRFDADFMAVVGAHLEFRIPTPAMRTWPLFLEGKVFILPQDYDFNHKLSTLTNITFGIKHDINYDPYHKSIPGESRGWNYDWFVGLGVGPNFSVMGIQSPEVTAWDRVGMNADVTFGRNFSSLWTVRIGLSAMKGTTEKKFNANFDAEPYTYAFFNGRADLMFNVVNIGGMRRGRHLGILPYAGAGFIKRFDQKIVVMQADAGVMARWYISRGLDIYADGRYIMVPPRFNWGHEMMNNGYPLLNVGIIYNFDPSSSRYAKAAFRLRN